jgi:hypothetical protein
MRVDLQLAPIGLLLFGLNMAVLACATALHGIHKELKRLHANRHGT